MSVCWCCGISSLGCKKIKKNKKQKSIDAGRILENIYEECFLFSTQNFLHRKNKNRDTVVKVLFMLLFGFMILAEVLQWNMNTHKYRYYVLVWCMLMLLISIICWEKEEKHINWNKPLLYVWIAIWGVAFVSNLFVTWEITAYRTCHADCCRLFLICMGKYVPSI